MREDALVDEDLPGRPIFSDRRWIKVLVVYRLPLYLAVALVVLHQRSWGALLIFLAAVPLGRTRLLSLGALVAAWRLGTPFWLVVAFAVAVTLYGPLVRKLVSSFPTLLPERVLLPGGIRCGHGDEALRSKLHNLIRSGEFEGALDMSLELLASHPQDPVRCLQGRILQVAELAAAAGAPQIARIAADRAVTMKVRHSSGRFARASYILGWSNSMAGTADLAIEHIDNGLKASRWRPRTRARLARLRLAVSNLGAEESSIILSSLNLGTHSLGRGVERSAFDTARLFASQGAPTVAYSLWAMMRASTNVDSRAWPVVPQVAPTKLARRWELQESRWSRAVAGMLSSALQAEGPSAQLIEASHKAAEILISRGLVLPGRRSLIDLAQVHQKRSEHDQAFAAARDALAIDNAYSWLVIDWDAGGRWTHETSVARRIALDAAEHLPPLNADTERIRRLDADLTYLHGSGLEAARRGEVLARMLVDGPASLSDELLIRTCDMISWSFPDIDLPAEALAAVRTMLARYDSRSKQGRHVGIAARGLAHIREGRCLEDMKRFAEASDAYKAACRILRVSSLDHDNLKQSCLHAVRSLTRTLVASERLEESIPIAVEAVRRGDALASNSAALLRSSMADYDRLRDILKGAGRDSALPAVSAFRTHRLLAISNSDDGPLSEVAAELLRLPSDEIDTSVSNECIAVAWPEQDYAECRDATQPAMETAISAAGRLAAETDTHLFDPEFLLFGLLLRDEPLIGTLSARTGISGQSLREDLLMIYGITARPVGDHTHRAPSQHTLALLEGAARSRGVATAADWTTSDLLAALLHEGGMSSQLSRGYGLTLSLIETQATSTGNSHPRVNPPPHHPSPFSGIYDDYDLNLVNSDDLFEQD